MAALYGAHDAGVCSRNHAGLTLWLLGYPDGAARRVADALALAERLAHPFSLCQALFVSSVIRQFRRDVEGVREFAERLVATATEHGVSVFRESGVVLWEWSIAAEGDINEGFAQMQAGLDALRAMEAGLRRSYFRWLLADARARAGEYDAGLEVLRDAIAFVGERGEHWWESEIYHLRGELLVRRSPRNPGEADAAFVRAIETARLQSAKCPELRAATSLARLYAEQGERRRPTTCSPRSTAGSPRASIPPILRTPRRCSTG
jgi:predicted ATPase